jgi:hypothetical protein
MALRGEEGLEKTVQYVSEPTSGRSYHSQVSSASGFLWHSNPHPRLSTTSPQHLRHQHLQHHQNEPVAAHGGAHWHMSSPLSRPFLCRKTTSLGLSPRNRLTPPSLKAPRSKRTVRGLYTNGDLEIDALIERGVFEAIPPIQRGRTRGNPCLQVRT